MLFLSGFGDASQEFQIASVPPVQLPDHIETTSGTLVPAPFKPRDVPFPAGGGVTSIPVGPDIQPTPKPADILGLIPQHAPGIEPGHDPACRCGGARKPSWWPGGVPAPDSAEGWLLVGAGAVIALRMVFGR